MVLSVVKLALTVTYYLNGKNATSNSKYHTAKQVFVAIHKHSAN